MIRILSNFRRRQIYSVLGGIFFFLWGPYFFFEFPEW